MFQRMNTKTSQIWILAMLLATVLAGLASVVQVEAAPAAVVVPVNEGWVKFSWSPAVRGPFTFSLTSTSIHPELLTLPSRLTFTASAKVACPETGNAQVTVKVYDFGQLLSTTVYPVNCAATTTAVYPTAKTGNDYLSDTHYFHGSVALPTGGAHDIVVQTDLSTSDTLFWAYARVDTSPNTPPTDSMGNGAIALTATGAPSGAWVAVQWADPTGAQWTTIDTWLGPLDQSQGWMAYWIEAKDQGTGPYRWVVYTGDPSQGGQVWGISDPFNFPRQSGQWIWSQVIHTTK
jgi:hypothetical protein